MTNFSIQILVIKRGELAQLSEEPPSFYPVLNSVFGATSTAAAEIVGIFY